MNKMKKLVSLALLLASLFALSLPAAAADETKNIEITYRGIKIVVDGEAITPADANGMPVEPFIYGGTTYLPIRAVAGALGLSVVWDDGNSTVFLTSGAQVTAGGGTPAATEAAKTIQITYRDIKICIDGKTITPRDAAGATVEPFIFDGTTYLPVRAVASALGVEVGWDGKTGTVYLGEQPAEKVWLPLTETDYDSLGAVNYTDTYTYDKYWRCTAVTRHYPDYPESDYTVTKTYDADGNMIFEDYGDGYSRYSYDSAGNLISDKYYYGGAMVEWQYSYDDKGRLKITKIIDEYGDLAGTAVYTYDARGDLVMVVSDYGDAATGYSVTETFAYVYGSTGLLESCEYANSCDESGSYEYGAYYLYNYDLAGRLAKEYQYWVEAGEKEYMDTIIYAYDGNGNLERCLTDSGFTLYTYILKER